MEPDGRKPVHDNDKARITWPAALMPDVKTLCCRPLATYASLGENYRISAGRYCSWHQWADFLLQFEQCVDGVSGRDDGECGRHE
jgi:hypothetical protein